MALILKLIECEIGKFENNRSIGDSLRENPESLFTNRKIAAEMMKTGHYAYPAVKRKYFYRSSYTTSFITHRLIKLN